ncbi:MAG: hypothetical protein E6H74_11255 [Betaproteobacteria bacterium]|nr:MAG: hypothetical protein E6H74_11255 [Betaproteobacteria bacterium]
MYRVGIGTPVDNVKAYTWFNLAAARGHEEADRARIMVLPLLSRADVIEAQKEALRWTEEMGSDHVFSRSFDMLRANG